MGKIYSIYLEVSGCDQALFEKVCVATLDHEAGRDFSVKPSLKRGAVKPFLKRFALSRLITPTMLLPGFSVKPFFKRLAIDLS
jgi:hypothetical protein